MIDTIMLAGRTDKIKEPKKLPAGYSIRQCKEGDLKAIGQLYFKSYDPGEACQSEEESIADIKNSFEGEYGPFWWEASRVAEAEGKIVGAMLTVHEISWDDQVNCPYIIELFVDRKFRRKGIAESLVTEVLCELNKNGKSEVALTVSMKNKAALNLYKKYDFVESTIYN